ncbi:hypothetical protein EG328_002884 [Venturia inaequalis]|uniref:Uncharacterized protein n=1 Tax=Venturia inaequalis TaxID=5025 RepID=A0A8H3UUK8_VENIN|nr:hypothetical protein EG328_002884 [Venturia inaequalis]RDI77958.1 hypothetical protein Vi05172_g12037 [Venturia inaequalis]
MNSPTKPPIVFPLPRTPTRRVLQDIGNIITPPSPRRRVLQDKDNYSSPPPSPRKAQVAKLEHDLHNALEESAKKEKYIDWVEANYSGLRNEQHPPYEHSRSPSLEKLHQALCNNVQLNTCISHLEEENSKNSDQKSKLEIEVKQCRNEINKLRRVLNDSSRHLETRESEIAELVEEIGRLQTKMDALEGRILGLLDLQARDKQERAELVRVNKELHTDVKHAFIVINEKDKIHEQDKDEIEELKNESAPSGKRLIEKKAKTMDTNDVRKKLETMTQEIEELRMKHVDSTAELAQQLNINLELGEKLTKIQNKYMELQGEKEVAEIKRTEAQEMEQQNTEPCMMMKEGPSIIYKVLAGTARGNDHPGSLSPNLASASAVGLIQPWKRLSNLLAPLSRFLYTITIAKMGDAETMDGENNEFEIMVGYESSEVGAEAEAEAEPPKEADREDAWDSNPLFRLNESGEGQDQEPSVFTDEEENMQRISQSLGENSTPEGDRFHAFLHQHF